MQGLNKDTTHLIYKNLDAIDKLNLYGIFDEHVPTQFEVSLELMKKQQIQGNRGLYYRATGEGEFEACVAAMLIVVRDRNWVKMSEMRIYEEYLRSDWTYYESFQRVNRLRMLGSYLKISSL